MKRCIFTMLGIACIACCLAQSVSREMAAEVGLAYWAYRHADTRQTPTYRISTISPSEKAPLYVLQMDEGWVLVASEKAVVPILASASTGEFPAWEEMPDGMQWLLSYYEAATQYARDSIPDARTNEEWEQLLNGTYATANQNQDRDLPSSYTLNRMALAKWGQSYNNDNYNYCAKPYNAYCPTWYDVSCGRTVVGCDAVAMGMVMWYWQWPYSAIIPRKFANMENINNYVNIPYLATYDWAHMPPEIYNNTVDYDANLVAYFLRDCGYAVRMLYNSDGSSSNLEKVQDALENVFHYNSITYQEMNLALFNAWITQLKQEISSGRPVIYRGEDANGKGHAFVLYGYTTDNKFSINWGWNGDSGDYTLNPSGDILYPYEQAALFGIEPQTPICWLPLSYLYQSNVSNTLFEIHKNGTLVTSNGGSGISIQTGQKGCIYASEEIQIRSPFVIQQGATVHIAIRDALCDNRTSSTLSMPSSSKNGEQTEEIESVIADRDVMEFMVSPNPANDYIEIRSNAVLTAISIINSNGVCVLQTTELSIPVSHLPSGLYIVCATTEKGLVLQSKMLKE